MKKNDVQLIQLPANLMERIGQQVPHMNPTPPSVAKPLVPWAAIGTAAVLAVLAFGTGNRYLDHFQQPYSFEAQAEPTIEIVDARIVLDIDAKPALRNPIQRTIIPRKHNGGTHHHPHDNPLSTIRRDLVPESSF